MNKVKNALLTLTAIVLLATGCSEKEEWKPIGSVLPFKVELDPGLINVKDINIDTLYKETMTAVSYNKEKSDNGDIIHYKNVYRLNPKGEILQRDTYRRTVNDHKTVDELEETRAYTLERFLDEDFDCHKKVTTTITSKEEFTRWITQECEYDESNAQQTYTYTEEYGFDDVKRTSTFNRAIYNYRDVPAMALSNDIKYVFKYSHENNTVMVDISTDKDNIIIQEDAILYKINGNKEVKKIDEYFTNF